jgi:hypothetical protein
LDHAASYVASHDLDSALCQVNSVHSGAAVEFEDALAGMETTI